MSETSNALVERLTAGTELVAEGGFHLDLEAAQAKLADYRLADPESFVLLLVEVAHLLPGCSRLSFEQGFMNLKITWQGVALDDATLRELVEARNVALGPRAADDPVARARQQALQALSVALLSLESLGHQGAYLSSSAALEQIQFTASAASRFGPRGDDLDHPQLRLFVVAPLTKIPFMDSRRVAKHRADLLRARARYASTPVEIDGEQISEGFRLRELGEPLVVRDADRHVIGVIGLSPARPRATLLLVANGVLLEKVTDAELPPHFVALVQASDLPRDLSLTKLLRGDAYARRIQQIRSAARNVSGLGGEIATYVGKPATMSPVVRAMSIIGLLMLIASVPLMALGGPLGTIGFMMLFIGPVLAQPASEVRALRRNRSEESRAIATVLQALPVGSNQQRVECLVHVSGGEPYTGHVTVPSLTPLTPGQRIHVHISRRHPHFLYAAAPPPPMLPAAKDDA